MMKSAAILALAALSLVGAEPTSHELFNPSVVHEVRLDLNPNDWSTLKQRYRENTFYQATFRWNGQAVANVGIRSRGNGTRSGIKPGLRVDFDKYDKTRRFAGLASVVLDNHLQDPSYIRERIAMKLFAKMGFAAPRESPARLYVNGEFAGLYALVERIDTTFLRRVFGDDTGDLYDYNWIDDYRFAYLGDDPKSYTTRFEPKNSNADPTVLVDMIRTINQASDEDFVQAVSEYLDLGSLIRYLAIEAYIGESDGLAGYWGLNNFYLYRPAGQRRFTIIPWDKDFTFQTVWHPADYNLATNVLTRRVMANPEYHRQYTQALEDVARLADGWLEEQVHALDMQVRSHAPGDPFHAFEKFDSEITHLVEFARSRGPVVMEAAVAMRDTLN
jgi:spore coat protein CotH